MPLLTDWVLVYATAFVASTSSSAETPTVVAEQRVPRTRLAVARSQHQSGRVYTHDVGVGWA